MYLGSWKIDDLLTFVCNTHAAATGAATDADSVPSYRVYEDETGTAILTGSMAKLDDANTTGFYSEQIALSAANGFEKGKCYHIYVSATVSSVTGTMSHSFQIEAEVDANRLNWANVDNPTTTVGLSGTSVKTATDVETDTADIQTKIGSPAGASVSADIADVESKVDDLETRLGTPSDLGSGATIAANLVDIESQTDDIPAILEDTGTTLPGTLSTIESKIDTVDGIVDNILTDTAEIGAAGAGLSALPWNAAWDAEVQSEVQDAIEANHLDHLLAADYDPASKPGVATALLNELVESDGGVSRFTANALEEAPTGGSAPTAGEIADAVWDEALADHNTEDSFGNVLNDLVDEDGGGVYQFTANALELAPTGSGSGDWTSGEKEQIRYRLQMDGTQTAPAANAPLQMPVSADAVSQNETAAENFKLWLDNFQTGKITTAIIPTNKSFSTDLSGTETNQYINYFLLFTSGNLIHQIKRINAYQAPTGNKIFYFTTGFTQAPAENDTFIIIPISAYAIIDALTDNGVLDFDQVTIYQTEQLGTQAKADVNAEMDSALADYDPPTHAELTAALAALNNLSAAEVQTKIEEFWQTFSLPELAAGQSPAEATPAEIMAFLWMYFRGPQQSEKTGETTGIQRVHNDAGEIVLDAAFTKTETEYTREKLSLGD